MIVVEVAVPDLRGLAVGALPDGERVPEVEVLELRPELEVLAGDVEHPARQAGREPRVVERHVAGAVVPADEELLALAAAKLLAACERRLGLADERPCLALDGRPRLRRRTSLTGTVAQPCSSNSRTMRSWVESNEGRFDECSDRALRFEKTLSWSLYVYWTPRRCRRTARFFIRAGARPTIAWRDRCTERKITVLQVINATSALWRGIRLVGPGQATSVRARGLAALPGDARGDAAAGRTAVSGLRVGGNGLAMLADKPLDPGEDSASHRLAEARRARTRRRPTGLVVHRPSAALVPRRTRRRADAGGLGRSRRASPGS